MILSFEVRSRLGVVVDLSVGDVLAWSVVGNTVVVSRSRPYLTAAGRMAVVEWDEVYRGVVGPVSCGARPPVVTRFGPERCPVCGADEVSGCYCPAPARPAV